MKTNLIWVNKSKDVEDFHTYFVGEAGILVHNACGGDVVDNVIDENYIPRTPSNEEIKKADEFREMAKKRGF